MSTRGTDRVWLYISIAFFFLFSVSFLLMPFGDSTSSESVSVYTLISGSLFWISLLSGIFTQVFLSHRRKKWYVKNHVIEGRFSGKLGLVSFFSNTEATVADVICMISFSALAISMVLTHGVGYVCYIFLSVFVFSFSMHCILNGKNYYHIVNREKMLRSLEKRRVNTVKK